MIHLLIKLQVDDPVGCVGVHWGAGLWGMIATGLFGMNGGVFRGGDGNMLAYNLAAAICITLWSFGLTAIIVSLSVFAYLHNILSYFSPPPHSCVVSLV